MRVSFAQKVRTEFDARRAWRLLERCLRCGGWRFLCCQRAHLIQRKLLTLKNSSSFRPSCRVKLYVARR